MQITILKVQLILDIYTGGELTHRKWTYPAWQSAIEEFHDLGLIKLVHPRNACPYWTVSEDGERWITRILRIQPYSILRQMARIRVEPPRGRRTRRKH